MDECFNNCTSDLDCVAVDLNKNFNPFRCWPHFRDSDIVHANIYLQEGTTLFIPVKRCIASLYCKQLYFHALFISNAFFRADTTSESLLKQASHWHDKGFQPWHAIWRATDGITRDSVRRDAWRCGSGEVVRAMSWLKF